MEVKRREDLLRIKEEYLDRQKSYKRQVLVCGGAGCISSNCGEVRVNTRDRKSVV